MASDLPAGWMAETLGDVCARLGGDIQTGPFGSQLHAREYTDTGTPVVMPQDLIDGQISEGLVARVPDAVVKRLERHRLKIGDIVCSRRGDLGRNAVVGRGQEGWLCGTGCLRVRLGHETVARWIGAQLLGPDAIGWLYRHAVGATMPNLNTDILGAIPVVMPAAAELERLVAFFTLVEDKIQSNEAARQGAHDVAESVFRHRFGSGLEGLEPLTGHVTLVKGRSYKSAELQPSSTALVTLKNFSRDGTYAARGLKPYIGTSKPEQAVTSGDVLVAGTDLTQDAAVVCRAVRVPHLGGFAKLVASLDTFLVRPSTEHVSSEWLLFYLRSKVWLRHAIGYANGSTVLHLSGRCFDDALITVPSPEAVNAFTGIARPLLELADGLHAEIDDLVALREGLRARLVTGRLRLPRWAETVQSVEEVAAA